MLRFQGHIQMRWEINYVEGQRIVQVKPSGPMSWDNKKRLSEETLAAGRKIT